MARATWRSADLRGDPGRPGSVSAVVRRVHRGLEAASWGESALLGAAALLGTLAAAVVSGAELARAATWGVALVGAAAAGGSWRLEHRSSVRGVALALDRRLRHQGALVTAWELERRGAASSGLGAAVRARVLERLRAGEAVRALLPPLLLPLAAPFLAAVALALALETRGREAAGGGDLGALGHGLAEALAGAHLAVLEAGEVGAIGSSDARDALATVRRVQVLGRDLEGPGERAEAAEVDRLSSELAGIQRRLDVGPPEGRRLAAELDELRPWLDAARAELARREAAAAPRSLGGAGGAEPGGAEGGDAGGPADGAGAVPGGSGDAPGPVNRMAPTPSDGTMAGPVERTPDPIAPVPAPGDPEAGTIAGAWWPPEHDEIVRRWVDARAAALGSAPPDR